MNVAASEQHERALRLANQIRSARSKVRKGIHEGTISAQAIIADPPAEMRTASVGYVLRSVRRAGMQKLRTVCYGAGVSEITQLGKLTPGQRERIIKQMERWSCFRK